MRLVRRSYCVSNVFGDRIFEVIIFGDDMKTSYSPILSFVLIIVLAACSSSVTPAIEISWAWVRAVAGDGLPGQGAMMTPEVGNMSHTEQGMNSAAYLRIKNRGGADRLLRVESNIAQAVELHESMMENDIMTMRPVSFIEIPAGGEVELKPGGLHIMLIGLNEALMPGAKVQLTLVFEKAGNLTVEAEVRAP